MWIYGKDLIVYIPHDKMTPLMQRPTQTQLDHERDVQK